MKKYIDSKKGIWTDGYNHYVVDLTVYPFLTDEATIDNADELISIFNNVHAKGGQLTAVENDSGYTVERSVSKISLVYTTKALNFVVTDHDKNGAIVKACQCSYLSGTWTVVLKKATTAWDT